MSHPAMTLWTDPQHGLLARIFSRLQMKHAHPARTVVVLPFAQLRPLALRLWGQQFHNGFAPRFETTTSWASALGAALPQADDVRLDVAFDTLTATEWLARAGLTAKADVLQPLLVDAVHQIAPIAAARPPSTRAAWAQTARLHLQIDVAGEFLQWETAISRIAIAWAAASSFATDVLFETQSMDSIDAVVQVQGFLPDPVGDGLAALWCDRWTVLPLISENLPVVQGSIYLHAARDAEDEAQRSAACALRLLDAGLAPLALVSSDRSLTRRVRAMLGGQGVQIRDENGWKLSTTHSAAALMSALKACAWDASSDAVLTWLKLAPALAPQADSLELVLRRRQIRDWNGVAKHPKVVCQSELQDFCQRIEAMRAPMQGRHSIVQWSQRLTELLANCALLGLLQRDTAGQEVLAALRLSPLEAAEFEQVAGYSSWGGRRLDLAEFTQWVNRVLEASNYKPLYPDHEEVVIVPMSQTLARPFAAVVLAGCDEVRLSPSPDMAGHWTPAQRAVLGLPARQDLEHSLRQSWDWVLRTPKCDVLWRTSDGAGEALLPSTLVQCLFTFGAAGSPAPDPREVRTLEAVEVPRPQPVGATLALRHWTQGALEDLRQCPYRFFALRQLGLRASDELESDVDKRDFGIWLHEVFKRFHNDPGSADAARAQRRTLIDECAALTTIALELAEGEFLPFAAAWPAVREGYLAWLEAHEQQGARFESAEVDKEHEIGGLTLIGRVDRIDRLPDGQLMVLDYKTENLKKSQDRAKDPLEDTQIAFYAALLSDQPLRAAYVNVGERGETKTVEQISISEARDALIDGLLKDSQRIDVGAALPALGEGLVCDYCEARGLCRRDFWSAP
jgi:ATP-dependent helicase/nuclease subunit B